MRAEEIQNIGIYNLGTDIFFSSVHTISILYSFEDDDPDIKEDLNILQRHFLNLKCLNLDMDDYLFTTEIFEMNKYFKINLLHFTGVNYEVCRDYVELN